MNASDLLRASPIACPRLRGRLWGALGSSTRAGASRTPTRHLAVAVDVAVIVVALVAREAALATESCAYAGAHGRLPLRADDLATWR